MGLPRFVVIESKYNNKYLRCIKEDVQMHGFLQFSGDEVLSPYSKFEMQPAKRGDGLVHLQCCYNNKYCRRSSENFWRIAASTEEPEEDSDKWSCTLFEPVSLSEGVQFVHFQLRHYACLWRAHPPFESCLFAGSNDPNPDKCDVYTIIDWETLLIMPKHVAFKGDNGKYLRACMIDDQQYLQFASTDIGDETVGNEVVTTHDGSIHIKSDHMGKFWRRSPNWIWADADDTTSTDNFDRDTLFWPIKVEKNIVALCNLGNFYFCKRLSADNKTDCLNAAVSTISREAQIQVEESVISRQIYNVNFCLMDARIYNETVLTMQEQIVVNDKDEPDTVEVQLKFTDTRSSTWKASASLKLGVKTSLKAGIPVMFI